MADGVDELDEVGLCSSIELTGEADITYKQLDYWVRVHLLEPAPGPRGSGTQRRFHPREIVVARVVGRLSRAFGGAKGTHLDALEGVAQHVRDTGASGFYEFLPGITLNLGVLGDEQERDPDD